MAAIHHVGYISDKHFCHLPVGVGFSSNSSVKESRKEHHFGAGPSAYNAIIQRQTIPYLLHIF